MAFAQGSRSGISYVVESTFGVTPASPAMISLPVSSFQMNLNKETLESSEIRSDRLTNVQRHGNRQIGGSITGEFRPTDFDDLLECAFFNTFDTSELRLGITPQYLTIEDRAEDITQYRRFTGCTVNTMSMSVQPNEMVNVTFDMVGKDMTVAQTALDSDITADSGLQPFDSFNGILEEGGSQIASISSLEFSINNTVNPTFVIGQADTPQLEFGRGRVTGSLTAYFENVTLLNKFVDETESSLILNLNNGAGNAYQFSFPRIKYNSSDITLENEQSRLITINFEALRDTTEETNLVLYTA